MSQDLACGSPCYLAHDNGYNGEAIRCLPGESCGCNGLRICGVGGYCVGNPGTIPVGGCTTEAPTVSSTRGPQIQGVELPSTTASLAGAGTTLVPPVQGTTLSSGFRCCPSLLAAPVLNTGSAASVDSIDLCTLMCNAADWCAIMGWNPSAEQACYIAPKPPIQIWGNLLQASTADGQNVCVKTVQPSSTSSSSSSTSRTTNLAIPMPTITAKSSSIKTDAASVLAQQCGLDSLLDNLPGVSLVLESISPDANCQAGLLRCNFTSGLTTCAPMNKLFVLQAFGGWNCVKELPDAANFTGSGQSGSQAGVTNSIIIVGVVAGLCGLILLICTCAIICRMRTDKPVVKIVQPKGATAGKGGDGWFSLLRRKTESATVVQAIQVQVRPSRQSPSQVGPVPLSPQSAATEDSAEVSEVPPTAKSLPSRAVFQELPAWQRPMKNRKHQDQASSFNRSARSWAGLWQAPSTKEGAAKAWGPLSSPSPPRQEQPRPTASTLPRSQSNAPQPSRLQEQQGEIFIPRRVF